MSISAFIRDTVLLPRLRKAGCLVVYDPDRRYEGLCTSISEERIKIVDASESSIESREAAIFGLRELGKVQREIDAMLIYVPAARPRTDEEKQADPFALYGECGAVFPQDDGDDYLSLCLRAKPDHATEVRRVFASTPEGPPFSVIDAIGGGARWPQLRSALRVESAREILAAFLVPSPAQLEALKSQTGWVDEAREFMAATLGLQVKTRGKTWNALSDELWRFVLFSEFVFDLPGDLPAALQGVPQAPIEARPIIDDVCEGLRANPAKQIVYIERAEAIESELDLPTQCTGIDDLGERDTFPFEERTFLKIAIQGITSGDTDATRRMLARHKNSVWLGKGESQAQWGLVSAALSLVEACEDFERQLPDHARSQEALLNYYVGSLREADRLQREFEQAAGDFLDHDGLMHEVIEKARARYSRLAEKVQTVFVKHLESAGWPPQGRLANAQVFDRIVADRLKEDGHRVAYLMIDALRYELGIALERMLAEDGPVELQAAYAQLPSITLVGMASLLPAAQSELTLSYENGKPIPKLGDVPVGTVPQRMGAIKKRYGDRFHEMLLNDFVRGKPKIPELVDLLVLRSTEIDSQLENNPETTLSLIPGTLKLIRAALTKLRQMGFKEAVIVTDHGFFLNGHAEAGDVCAKPQGNWLYNAHDRILLGNGNADAHSTVIESAKLGIRGDFAQAALPRTMAPYRAGHLYFHGGASLAEAVVPVLVAKLDSEDQEKSGKISVELSYKNGATRITTRVPVIGIRAQSDDMFALEESIEVLVEAQDAKGEVVGEPRTGGDIDPATRTLRLVPGETKQIAMRMDAEFEGKFTIKALNPTTLASYSSLSLSTDYTV